MSPPDHVPGKMSALGGTAWRVFRTATSSFFARDGMVYSAAVAFNLLLSIIPVMFLVFAATSWFIGSDELPFAQLSRILREAFPYGADVLVPNLKRLFASRAAFGILGSVLLLFSSFSATDAVHTSLAVMLGKPQGRKIWRSALFHVAFFLSLILLCGAAIVVPPVWKGLMFLTRRMPQYWGAPFHLFLSIFADVVLAAVLFGGGILSYRYLSPARVRLRNAVAGASVFIALMYGIRLAFRFYVVKFGRLSLIYGSLFGIVSFIIVAYLFAAAYLYCASIIAALESEDGKVAPAGQGT